MRRSTVKAASTAATAAAAAVGAPRAESAARLSSTSASDGAAADGPKPGSLRGLGRTEFIYICCVFAVTGSSAAYLVRPTIRYALTNTTAGGSFANAIGIADPGAASIAAGPNSFRLLYFTVMMPMYSMLLFTFGTLAGRSVFFRHFLVKMWSRMMPKAVHQRFEHAMIGGLKKQA